MRRLETFPDNSIIRSYRRVFSSPAGKDVLVHMLFELGFMHETLDDGDKILKMYAERLLNILGGGEPAKETLQTFAMTLMKQQLPKERTEEDG